MAIKRKGNKISGDATITLKCNNNCVFCPRETLSSISCEGFRNIKKHLVRIRKKSSSVTLSGGEVTILPELFKIIDECKKLGFSDISIITNGRRLSDKNFSKEIIKKEISSMGISVYSTEEKIHDSITKVSGSLRQTLGGIKNILGKVAHIWVNIAISSINQDGLFKTINDLYSMGAREFLLINIVTNEKKLKIEEVEFKKTLKNVFERKLSDVKLIFRGFSEEINTFVRDNPKTDNNIIVQESRFDTFVNPENGNSGKYFSLVRDIVQKEKHHIHIHKENYLELSRKVNSLGKEGDFEFRLISPKEAKDKEVVYVSPNIVAPYLKRVIRGIKEYRITDIPKCILFDTNIENPKSKEKKKIASCRKCVCDDECGGIFCNDSSCEDLSQVLFPISSEKLNLMSCVGGIIKKDSNKFHSLGIINSTSVCNINCVFCNEGDWHKYPKHIDRKIVESTILGLKKRGVTSINFMGGEATTRPDLLEILDFIKANGMKVGVATNAVKFCDSDFCREVMGRLDFMEVSLHSIKKKTFDNYTRSNKFDDYFSGLLNISDLNKKLKKFIVFNILLGSFNYRELEDNVKFITQNFDKENSAIHFRMIEGEGNAFLNPGCRIGLNKCINNLVKSIDAAKKSGFSVKVDSIPPCFLKGHEDCSRVVLESMQKLNQYYFNKVKLSKDIDFEEYYNKHLTDKPPHKACSGCSINFICKGVDEGQFLDSKRIARDIFPIKKDMKEIMKKAYNNKILRYEI